jgi:hypothetical protein
MDLCTKLEVALVDVPAELGGGRYLPQDALKDHVTEPHVTTCCKEEGVPENLSGTIVTSAPKLFALLLLSNKMKWVQDMLGCGLRDHHLPLAIGEGGDKDCLVSCDGAAFRPFSGAWDRPLGRDVKDLLKKQYLVNFPVLDDSGSHYTFDKHRPLPFVPEFQPLGHGGGQVFDCTILPGYFRTVKNHNGDPASDTDVNYATPRYSHTSLGTMCAAKSVP